MNLASGTQVAGVAGADRVPVVAELRAVVGVRDAAVVVRGQPERVARVRQVGHEERREARDVAGERLREHVDERVGDGVEVRLAAVVRLELRERVASALRPACTQAPPSSPPVVALGELLLELADRVEVLVQLLLLGRRQPRRSGALTSLDHEVDHALAHGLRLRIAAAAAAGIVRRRRSRRTACRTPAPGR